jgi:O-antigen ligase
MHLLLAGYMFLFIHRPFEVWPILAEVRLERIYMLLTLAVWLGWPQRQSLIPSRLNRAFVLLTTAILLSWWLSPYPDKCTVTVENYLKVTVFYVLLMTTIRDENQLKRIVAIYLGVVFLYMSHSLWEFLCGRHVYQMGVPRMIGIDKSFSDPNTFAATLCYSLPLVFPFWNRSSDVRSRLPLLAYVGLSLLCILLTGSRTAFVLVGVLGVVLILKSRRRALWATVVMLAAFITWQRLPDDLRNRFMSLVDSSRAPANAQVSAEGRIEGLVDGIRIWQQRPLLGAGPGAFMAARGIELQAHNLYGQVLGELGSFGAIAFLAVLVGFFGNFLESRRIRKQTAANASCFSVDLSFAVIVSVLLLLVGGLGGHNLYRYTWLWFGAFQSIALYSLRHHLVSWKVDRDVAKQGRPSVVTHTLPLVQLHSR